MSIDATVVSVYHNEDGSGHLNLRARDPKVAPAGQPVLYFDEAPHDVTALNGRDIWGDAGSIHYKDRRIAARIGYSMITFVVDEIVTRPTEPREEGVEG